MSKQSARLKTKRRPGDPWVSKNRVLNPTKSKRNCPIYRNPNFDSDETKLLIQLWGDPKVQRELITTHKKHAVIAQLATKMEEYGYYRSPEEIMTRIKNMKCFYNRLKKEMEANKNMDPSWRHFADMDVIMTRPIFSVRPNEVPAPSLKYLMEQEEENRKERRSKSEKEGIDITDSDDDINDVLAVPASVGVTARLDDECIIPDAEIKFECDDVTLAALANAAMASGEQAHKKTELKCNLRPAETAIKVEVDSEDFAHTESNNKELQSNKKAADGLITPKLEPIDVDEVDGGETANNATPTAPTASLMDILNQQQAKPSPVAFTSFAMPLSTTTTSTSAASSLMALPASSPSTATTPSKISVVSPTVLMPPSSQLPPLENANNATNRPLRIANNLQTLLASNASRSTVAGANGMKFILVPAGEQRKSGNLPQPTTMAIATANGNASNGGQTKAQTSPRGQRTVVQRSLYPQETQSASMSKQKAAESQPDKGDVLRKKELSGIKSSLVRLLKARQDANELQSQRLALERERLQHERAMSEKVMIMFEQNQKIQQQMLHQQQQILQITQQHQLLQLQQRAQPAAQQIFTTGAAGSGTACAMPANGGQIMMPPKLLITTMVPTSVAGAVAQNVNPTLGSKVISTANFKNLATHNNGNINNNTAALDKPLLVPKEEPVVL